MGPNTVEQRSGREIHAKAGRGARGLKSHQCRVSDKRRDDSTAACSSLISWRAMYRRCLLFASALIVAGCADGAKTPATPSIAPSEPGTPAPPLRTVVSLALCCGADRVALDTQRQIEARASYNDGSVTDVTAAVRSWTSADPAIATISNTGVVTALAPGDFQVSASYQGVQASWTLHVPPPSVPAPTPSTQGIVRIWLCCGSNQIDINTQRQILAQATYTDGSIKEITSAVTSWTSSNPSIATISQTGILTGFAPGTVDVSATFAGFRANWDLHVSQSVTRPPGLDTLTGYIGEQTSIGLVEIPYANIEIVGGTANGRVVQANSSGFFRIEGLHAAGFKLAITKRGYASAFVSVAELGRELDVTVMAAPGVLSDVLQGEVCYPTRTITRTFTPRVAGFLRITSSRNQSSTRAVYGDDVLIDSHVSNDEDVELRAGVRYELRVTGSCDYGPSRPLVLTLLRPPD